MQQKVVMTPKQCLQCFAELSPAEWTSHHQSLHSGLEYWDCPDCAFDSAHIQYATAHLLLEGHAVFSRKRASVAFPLLNSVPSKNRLASHPIPASKAISLASRQAANVRTSEFSTGSIEQPRSDNQATSVHSSPTREETCQTVVGSSTENDNRSPQEQKNNSGLEAMKDELVSDSESESDSAELHSQLPEPISSGEKATVSCKKCDSVLTRSRFDNLKASAKKHVRSCCNIREFACSSCAHLMANREQVRRHIQRSCPNAFIKRVDEQRCAMALKECMAVCFPGTELRKQFLPENAKIIHCANCSSVLYGNDVKGMRISLNMHVRSCLKIRPFSCSNCDYVASRKVSLRSHIKSRCQSASVVLVDKEGNDRAVEEGLSLCFPDHKIKAMPFFL